MSGVYFQYCSLFVVYEAMGMVDALHLSHIAGPHFWFYGFAFWTDNEKVSKHCVLLWCFVYAAHVPMRIIYRNIAFTEVVLDVVPPRLQCGYGLYAGVSLWFSVILYNGSSLSLQWWWAVWRKISWTNSFRCRVTKRFGGRASCSNNVSLCRIKEHCALIKRGICVCAVSVLRRPFTQQSIAIFSLLYQVFFKVYRLPTCISVLLWNA